MNSSGQRATELLPELAQQAYETFWAQWFTSRQFTPWLDLTEEERIRWRAVVDCVRDNVSTNRWSAFSDKELVIFDYYLDIEVENQPSETRLKMVEELQAELSRRHATGEGEK